MQNLSNVVIRRTQSNKPIYFFLSLRFPKLCMYIWVCMVAMPRTQSATFSLSKCNKERSHQSDLS